MKTKLMSLMIASATILAWNSPAFAIHNYRQLTCKSATHELFSTSTSLVGSYYAVKKLGEETTIDDRNITAVPSDLGEEYVQSDLDEADINFKTLSSQKISYSEDNTSDCQFDHSEAVTKNEIKFDKVNENVAKILNLKVGQTMSMECVETLDIVSDRECSDK